MAEFEFMEKSDKILSHVDLLNQPRAFIENDKIDSLEADLGAWLQRPTSDSWSA
jgi:hypothetical protein